MDDTVIKTLQAEFHRLNAACNEIQALVNAEQITSSEAVFTDVTRTEVLGPMRAKIRDYASQLLPLAKERTRIAQTLNGKTGPAPT